jgi:ABC-type lipoprotein release transport system permease subunit
MWLRLISLSFRNLFRYKQNNLLLVLAVVLGVSIGLLGVAFINGLVEKRQKERLDISIAHLKITHQQYNEDKKNIFFIPNTDSIIKEIRKKFKEIENITYRINFRGLAQKNLQNVLVDIYGVHIENEKKVLKLYQYIYKGTYLQRQKSPEVIIGEELAKKLRLKVNDSLLLQFQLLNEKIHIQKCKIVGIYQISQKNFSTTHIFLPFDFLKKILFQNNIKNKEKIKSHQILFRLDDKKQVKKYQTKLQQLFPHLKITTWIEVAPDLAYWFVVLDFFFFLFLGLIFLALGITLFNLMSMAVWARKNELQKMYALGISKFHLKLLIVFETTFLLGLGIPVAIFLCFILLLYWQKNGVNLSFWAEGLSVWGYEPIIYPYLQTEYYFYVFILAFVTALLVSFSISSILIKNENKI